MLHINEHFSEQQHFTFYSTETAVLIMKAFIKKRFCCPEKMLMFFAREYCAFFKRIQIFIRYRGMEDPIREGEGIGLQNFQESRPPKKEEEQGEQKPPKGKPKIQPTPEKPLF